MEIFSSEIDRKKISLKSENKFPETAEYDSACCGVHEKLYFSPSRNQF